MNPKGIHVNFASDKPFNQNLDENLNKSAKTEARKTFTRSFFLLPAEQRRRPIRL